MAQVQMLLNQAPGPLPLKGTFICNNDDALDLIVTGTSWKKAGFPSGPIGMEIYVYDKNNKSVGYTSGVVDSGLPAERKAVVSQFVQLKLTIGETYSFVVQPLYPEVGSDANDRFTATIVY